MTHHTGSDEGQWPKPSDGQRYVADRFGVVWLLVPQYDEGMATTADAVGQISVGINPLRERGPLVQVWPPLAARAAAPDALRERVERHDVDSMARVLMAAWEAAEGKPVTPSYVATFADMARAALTERPTDGAGT